MSRLEKTTKRLAACCGTVIVLCLPAFPETPIPDPEKRAVGDLHRQSVIPVAANNPGRFGAHFKTKVVIFNPSEHGYTITARLYDRTGLVSREEIEVNPQSYTVWGNFLETIFNYRGSGGIWLRAPEEDDRFYVTAEVYTDSPNGRFSTTVVNGIYPRFSDGYESNYSVGIFVNQSRRTNIGVLNWGVEPSTIEVRVYDDGMLVQTIPFELESEAWQQKSINVPVDNGFITWHIDGESDAHYFYAVEVDNESNDGTLSWAVKPED